MEARRWSAASWQLSKTACRANDPAQITAATEGSRRTDYFIGGTTAEAAQVNPHEKGRSLSGLFHEVQGDGMIACAYPSGYNGAA